MISEIICWFTGHKTRVVQFGKDEIGVICKRCDRVIAHA